MRAPLFNRREFLRNAGLGAASLALGGLVPRNALAARGKGSASLALSLDPGTAQVYPGAATDVFRFNGSMLHSTGATSLQWLPDSYLGPVIRTHQFETVAINVSNNLPESTVVHWHGLDVPSIVDGHPMHAVEPASRYKARLPILNRAGTYWYHPHPDMRTGFQVYQGLAGVFIVSDDEEQALALPRQELDVPLILQDRLVGADNEFLYMMGGINGMLGDRILVNGRPDYVHDVSTRVYRLRVLNGSNARIFKLSMRGSNLPMVVIGTDGGLLQNPVGKKYVTLAPGERVELWADFRHLPLGHEVVLQSLPFTGVGGTPGPALPQGAPFDVMRFRVTRLEQETRTLPATLSTYVRHSIKDAANRNTPRKFPITRVGNAFLLNGGPFEMHTVADNENIPLGVLELWEFSNPAGGSHLAHPIHVHGVQFQVHERIIAESRRADWETVRHGYTDEGWKDTILLMPGETVRVLIRFNNYTGLFLYHCHNLEHEDMGMMRNLMIHP